MLAGALSGNEIGAPACPFVRMEVETASKGFSKGLKGNGRDLNKAHKVLRSQYLKRDRML